MARNTIHEIDFTYPAQVRPPRARNVREVAVLDRLPISIRDLDDGEFPLVARVVDLDCLVKFAGEPIEVRSDGRRFYSRFVSESCETGGRNTIFHREPLAADALGDRIADHDNEGISPLRHVQRVPRPRWNDQPTKKADLAGEVVSDKRRERVAEVLDAAAKTVLHGGEVWYACVEPCWKIEQGKARAEFPRGDAAKSSPGTLWRADRLEDARRLLNRGVPFYEEFGEIEVFRSDLLRLAPEAAALLLQAEDARSGLIDGLATASREQFDAYATLRDALPPATTRDGVRITDEVATAIRGVLEDPASGLCEWRRERLATAFERWRLALVGDMDAVDVEPGRCR